MTTAPADTSTAGRSCRTSNWAASGEPGTRYSTWTPVPQAELPVWADYLLPAGFRGALGVALFTPDRRYLGLLGVTTERATPTGPNACNLAERLPEHAGLPVDPLRSLATIAGILQ